jgi:hypothetical protein
MKKTLAIIGLGSCLAAGSFLVPSSIFAQTRAQIQQAGFSDSFIAKLQKNSGKNYRQVVSAPGVWAQQDSMPKLPSPAGAGSDASGVGTPLPSPEGADSFDQPAPASAETAGLPPISEVKPAPPKLVKAAAASSGAKSSGSSAKKTKKKTRKAAPAPIVQSYPEPQPLLYESGTLPSPPRLSSARGAARGSQEIYSQEPLSLPSVNQLPMPSRTTLPPVTRDMMMQVPLGEAVSRVLACNFSGLTGLVHTTVADVSKEGSFKMGFHTNWYTLERVYDRVLATNESGKFFESVLFFNYAPTNDLEFAMMLPILDYTVKSRILWARDFHETGIGDTKLSFKYRIFDNPQHQMRGAFGLGFKFPTGSDDRGLGTGKSDFEVYTAFSKNFEKLIAHLNFGYVMTGDPNTQFYPDGLADIFYYNIGLEYPHTHNVTVMTELNGQDWGAEGMKVDVTPGIRYTPTENFAFEIGIPISVTNDQRYGYNYRVTFGVTSFFK